MRAFGVTDRGKVRAENQDAYQIQTLPGGQLLCVVCDGMGGAKAGSVASRLACEAFCRSVEAALRGKHELSRALRDGAADANRVVYEKSCSAEEYHGMGTTLAALCVEGQSVCVVNVGDSRVYAFDEAGIRCLTVDHSVVEWMVRRGELSSEQAKHHPSKNMITRAIGTDKQVECDCFLHKRAPGEVFLLCSDGLSNQLADQELLFEVVHGASYEDCCQRLLQIALNRGAPDNVTAILVCD